jgi:hypothetical protein
MPPCASGRASRTPAVEEVALLDQPPQVGQSHLARIGGVAPRLLLAEDPPEEADRRRLVGALLDRWMTRPLCEYWTYQTRPLLKTLPSPWCRMIAPGLVDHPNCNARSAPLY